MIATEVETLPQASHVCDTEHLRIFASRCTPPGATGRRVVLTAFALDEDKPEVLTCVLLQGIRRESEVLSEDGWIDLMQQVGHPYETELLAAANEMFGPFAQR